MKDYHINVFFSEENEGYIADIPDLTGRAIAYAVLAFGPVVRREYLVRRKGAVLGHRAFEEAGLL